MKQEGKKLVFDRTTSQTFPPDISVRMAILSMNIYSARTTNCMVAIYWRMLQTWEIQCILCRTPCTAYTRHQLRIRVTQAHTFAQPFFASCTHSPCQTVKIQRVHARRKVVYFSDPDVVPLIDRATMKCAVTLLKGSEKVRMAPITECHNLWNWLTDFPKLDLIATMLMSMHATAYASERNWSAWGIIFAKNRSKLGIQHAEQMIFLSQKHVLTEFSQAELQDLSLKDDQDAQMS